MSRWTLSTRVGPFVYVRPPKFRQPPRQAHLVWLLAWPVVETLRLMLWLGMVIVVGAALLTALVVGRVSACRTREPGSERAARFDSS